MVSILFTPQWTCKTISLKITYVKFHSNLPGNNELICKNIFSVPPRFIEEEGSGEDFTTLPESPEILQNQSIRLGCPVDAIPPPTITWFRDGRPLRPNDLSENLRIWHGGRELEISGARVEDTATYTCVARNLAGETEKVYHLKVHGRTLFSFTCIWKLSSMHLKLTVAYDSTIYEDLGVRSRYLSQG